jgi:type III secretion system YscJ/HrcJ family lipoprotein
MERTVTARRSLEVGRTRGVRAPARARGMRLCLLTCALALAAACGAKPVTSVPTESDAIEILDVLAQSGLEAEKREVGEAETRRWEIAVEEGFFGGGEAAMAVQVLRDHGLPRPEEPVNEESGLIPSERAEKQREQRRIRVDIERQLRALPGVTLALVTVVMPQDPTLELNPYPATASVVINYKDERPAFTEQQIQNLVAKGVPNLKSQDVSVTMSQQTPRPLPQRELAARRRNNILLAAVVGLLAVLGSLSAVLLLRRRRRRLDPDDLSEDASEPPESGESVIARPAEQPAGRLDT